MRLSIDVSLDYRMDAPADVLLQIEAAALPDQRLEAQELLVWSDTPIAAVPGGDGIGQRCLLNAVGNFTARYRSIVALDRPAVDLARLPATPPRALPAAAIPYLLPSRYCEADRFLGFVRSEFAGLEGGALALAMRDWVGSRLTYASGASSGVTTAMMTFAERRGVCRDYAHLLCALARAGNIPARCVSAYAPGVEPQDFHAVCELWIDGAWRLMDATGMAGPHDLVRVAVGRDATDIAFMTVFGTATLIGQAVSVKIV